jgi:hypothetical protein
LSLLDFIYFKEKFFDNARTFLFFELFAPSFPILRPLAVRVSVSDFRFPLLSFSLFFFLFSPPCRFPVSSSLEIVRYEDFQEFWKYFGKAIHVLRFNRT